MPTVPTTSAPRVQEQALSGGMQQSIASPELFSGNAEQLGKLGTAVGNLADSVDRIKTREESAAAFDTEIKVKTAAMDFEDQTRQRMRGSAAKGISNVMDQYWSKQIEEAGAELSPFAKRIAKQSLMTARLQSLTSAGDYERQEIDKAQNESWIGSKKVEIDRAAQSMDPTVAESAVGILREKNAQQRALKGWAADTLTYHNMVDTQALHKSMLNAYLGANDLDRADAYLQKNSTSMDINDVLHANTLIKKQRDVRAALGVATEEAQKAIAGANPPPIDRLVSAAGSPSFAQLSGAVVKVESNGNKNAVGPVVPGQGTAKGDQQVMDATNKDPGFGVQPARDDSPAERSRVGREYLGAMLREFGDTQQALAAYNAGPARVKKAIADANGGDWLALLPKETQDYVPKVLKAYGDGAGLPTARPTIQDVHTSIRQRVGQGNPELLRSALDEATRQFDDNSKAVKQREDEGEAAALKWLAANGGKFSALPPALRSNIPPRSIDNVMTAAQKFAKGDDTTDPIVFQKMATNDAWLKGMSDAEFFSQSMKLSESARQHMASRRGTLRNGAAGTKPSDLDYGTVNNLFNNRLAQMGVDPTPKDGSSGAQQVGVQREVVWNTVMAAQVQSGKKFTDVDIANKIDELFTKNIHFRNTVLGIPTGESNLPVLNLTPSDIPKDYRDRLKADFKARGIDATDQQLLGAYMRLKLSKK